MGALTRAEIKEIMMNPNSPESKVYIETKGQKAYDKMVKKGLAFDAKNKAKEEKDLDDKVKNIGRTKLNQGGVLKAAPNKGAASLPKGVRNSMGFMKKGGKVKGYEHGGAVKGKGKGKGKCRMDGIAIRGKTRAKQRSK